MHAATENIHTNPPNFILIDYQYIMADDVPGRFPTFVGPESARRTQHGPRASHMTTAKAHGRAHAFAGQLCLLHRIAITLLTFLNLQKKKPY